MPAPAPYTDGMTHLDCLGNTQDDRTCWVSNACFNVAGEAWPRHKLEFYSPGKACIQSVGGAGPAAAGFKLCDDDSDWIWLASAKTSFGMHHTTMKAGPIPAELVAAWVGEDVPVMVFSRFYPWNYCHVLVDDGFALFYALRTWLGWTGQSAHDWTAAGLTPLGVSDPAAQQTVTPPARVWNMLLNDFRGHDTHPALYTLFTRLFPNVRYLRPDVQFNASKERPLVCFRRVLMGSSGWSMMRNGAYSKHPAREWKPALSPDFDAATYLQSHYDYADHVAASFGRPQSRVAAAAAAVSAREAGRRGTVVLIQRSPKPDEPLKRSIRNLAELLGELRRSVGGREIVRHDFGNMTADIDVMRGADLVIAVHGAGSINLMFCNPGTAWIDLLPPRAVEYQPVMLAVAQRFDVRLFSQPLVEFDIKTLKYIDTPHDVPELDVHVGALTGLASLVLGAEP